MSLASVRNRSRCLRLFPELCNKIGSVSRSAESPGNSVGSDRSSIAAASAISGRRTSKRAIIQRAIRSSRRTRNLSKAWNWLVQDVCVVENGQRNQVQGTSETDRFTRRLESLDDVERAISRDDLSRQLLLFRGDKRRHYSVDSVLDIRSARARDHPRFPRWCPKSHRLRGGEESHLVRRDPGRVQMAEPTEDGSSLEECCHQISLELSG